MKNIQNIYIDADRRIIVSENRDHSLDVQYQELYGDVWRNIFDSETYVDMDTVLFAYGI